MHQPLKPPNQTKKEMQEFPFNIYLPVRRDFMSVNLAIELTVNAELPDGRSVESICSEFDARSLKKNVDESKMDDDLQDDDVQEEIVMMMEDLAASHLTREDLRENDFLMRELHIQPDHKLALNRLLINGEICFLEPYLKRPLYKDISKIPTRWYLELNLDRTLLSFADFVKYADEVMVGVHINQTTQNEANELETTFDISAQSTQSQARADNWKTLATRSATNGLIKNAKPDGRMLIQAEAYEYWLRLKASGANPTVNSICGPMAKWCSETGTTTHTGVTPTAGTLRNAILGGSSGWNPPTHNREQAKKHVAQLAQLAQS